MTPETESPPETPTEVPTGECLVSPPCSRIDYKNMTEKQEPKYRIEGDKIVNRASGEAIPEDEPIMIFRARDIHAHRAIVQYIELLRDPEHAMVVAGRAADFSRFAESHTDRMKEPDSVLPANS